MSLSALARKPLKGLGEPGRGDADSRNWLCLPVLAVVESKFGKRW
jgi:hypothetical protein